MIKRTYFISIEDVKKGKYHSSTYWFRSWYAKPDEVHELIMDDLKKEHGFEGIKVLSFNRV